MALDVRRDQVTLTPAERSRFKAALFAMKRMPLTRDTLAPSATDPSVLSPDPPAGGLINTPRNVYDQYVHWHAVAAGTGSAIIHRSPFFLPWHRWFVRLFEMDLKRADYLLYHPATGSQPAPPPAGQPAPGAIVMPYWDFCRQVDRIPAANQLRIPWTVDLIGAFPTAASFRWPGNNIEVGYVPGDFGDSAVWPIYQPARFPAGQTPSVDQLRRLTRQLANDTSMPLNDLSYAMRLVGEQPAEPGSPQMITVYDSNPWDRTVTAMKSFRNTLEGDATLAGTSTLGSAQLHNRAHGWVGGIMFNQIFSANDPAFFLLHANVDRYWRKWQYYVVQANGTVPDYPSVAQYPHPEANYDADMLPWQSGQPNHTEFGKLLKDTFTTETIGPTTFGSGWTSVPQTDGYRYDREPWLQPVVQGRP